jgi:hypothetical protein
MGLTLCKTTRRINRLKDVCVFIPPDYERLVHRRQTPGSLLLSICVMTFFITLDRAGFWGISSSYLLRIDNNRGSLEWLEVP